MAIQYVARKPITVGDRTIQPGEVVPEASTWKNVGAYVNSGHLAVAVEVPEGASDNAELWARVAALEERDAAREARVAALEKVISGEAEEDDLDAFFDADDLRTWDRAQLDELAADLGIKPPIAARETEDLIAEIVTIPVEIPAEEGEEASEGAPTGEPGDATPPAAPVDLSNWKLADLLALAARAGIQDPKFTKKTDAIEAIQAKATPEKIAALVAAQEGTS